MKKINYLGLVGLGCGALLLAGCGGKSHTLTCELKSDSQELKFEIEFDKDEKKAENVYFEMVIKLDDSFTEEQIESAKEGLEEGCKAQGNSNCKVKVDSKELKYSYEAEPDKSGLDLVDKSMEEAKTLAEQDGYTCK